MQKNDWEDVKKSIAIYNDPSHANLIFRAGYSTGFGERVRKHLTIITKKHLKWHLHIQYTCNNVGMQ
jgi:hypothetical protein